MKRKKGLNQKEEKSRKKRESTEKKTKSKDLSEKSHKKSRKSTGKEQEVSDEEQDAPEELWKKSKKSTVQVPVSDEGSPLEKSKKRSKKSATQEQEVSDEEKQTPGEKSKKRSKTSATQEQEVSDEKQTPGELHKKVQDQPMPESNASPESNAPPESTATAAKKPKKSKSEKLGNQLTQWFIDKKIQNWQGLVDNLTDQEKMNISNLLRVSQEKQVKIKSEEKSKTKEVTYETFKDELKKQSEKGDVVLKSEKGNGKKERDGDGSPSTVKTKKIPDKQKPQVKKEPAFQQESNVKDVKKKKKKSIKADHPGSPVIKIKQEKLNKKLTVSRENLKLSKKMKS